MNGPYLEDNSYAPEMRLRTQNLEVSMIVLASGLAKTCLCLEMLLI